MQRFERWRVQPRSPFFASVWNFRAVSCVVIVNFWIFGSQWVYCFCQPCRCIQEINLRQVAKLLARFDLSRSPHICFVDKDLVARIERGIWIGDSPRKKRNVARGCSRRQDIKPRWASKADEVILICPRGWPRGCNGVGLGDQNIKYIW